MRDCCEARPVHDRQRLVLRVVLAVNLAMFVVELLAGLLARSTALVADSADMLGDAVVYAFSLYVIGRGPRWQARAALFKGSLMAAFGLAVLVEVATKLIGGVTPDAGIMSGIGLLALAANAAVLAALWRHRGDDLNMRSVWLCSRNDVVANGGVLVAALGVAVTDSAWPDIVIGLGLAGLFGASAASVIRAAVRPVAASRRAETGPATGA
jgi:Co/Zn/Cd efflux system component